MMTRKNIIFATVLPLLLSAVLFGFTSADTPAKEGVGIDFFHGTVAEAKAKAKEEGKLIFVDAYTTWCGPCRWMAANTFTNEAVGKFFNENFVSLKLDMERGEGLAFGKQYRVMAYPTLLFLDHSGTVMHRAMGAKKADQFIELGKVASSKVN